MATELTNFNVNILWIPTVPGKDRKKMTNYISDCIKTINDIYHLKADFRMNWVLNGAGLHANYSLVYINDRSCYNIMLGLNPDGSSRTQRIETSFPIPAITHPGFNTWSWERKFSYIETVMMPQWNGNTREEYITTPSKVDFSREIIITRGKIKSELLKNGRSTCEFVIRNIPAWLTEVKLHQVFDIFKTIDEPKIDIVKHPHGTNAYLKFKASTTDGLVAFTICQFFEVEKPCNTHSSFDRTCSTCVENRKNKITFNLLQQEVKPDRPDDKRSKHRY